MSDSVLRIQDNGDATKQVAFEVSAVTTGTTRTLTVQDQDGTLALLSDVLGLDNLKTVRAATTTALPAVVYSNGSSGVGATLIASSLGALGAIDGVTLIAGDTLLVKNQASAFQNGKYTVTTVGNVGVAFVLTRATDSDQAAENAPGETYVVQEGSTLAGTYWDQTTANPIVMGTTNLVYTRNDIGLAALKANNLSDLASPSTALANLGGAPLASPALTGSPTAPTQAAGDNSTQIATDAFVTAALAPVTSVGKLLSGTTIPTNSVDKWKAGRSRQATRLNGAITNSATKLVVKDPSITPTSLHRRLWIEAEEIFTTAGEGNLTLTGVTSVATTGIFTKTAHGLVSGQMVVPTANIADSFLTAFTVYFVSATNLAPNTFSLAATSGGAVLTGTTNDTNLTILLAELTVQTRGSVNGSAAVSHADKAPVYAAKWKTVCHIGDSVVEGVDSALNSNDSWSIRAARMLADKLGGLVAQSWPYWRNTGTLGANQEYVAVANGGLILSDVNASHDCGYAGAINQAGVATTGSVITWTRPAGVRVQAIDFMFVDYGANATGFSYQVVDKNGVAGAWTNCPFASIYSSGKGILRRLRIAVDDPVSFAWRSCNAAGTAKTVVFPWVPLTTWADYPYPAITEGVHWANLGWAGKLLSGVLNARVVHDGVTNGTTTLTSTTAVFVANDVGSDIFVNGVNYTIASRTSATAVVLSGSPASATGVRVTILQGSQTGDWMASFYGHQGSWFPDLVIIGPFDNDLPNNEPDMYGDMLQWLYTQISPCADILFVAPYEFSSGPATPTIQASYRAVMHTIAAANNAAILDLYDFLVAYGVTAYAGMVTAGLLADLIHLNYKGNNWMGAHLARVLAEL